MVLATGVGTGQQHIQPCADKASDGLNLDQKGTMPEQPCLMVGFNLGRVRAIAFTRRIPK